LRLSIIRFVINCSLDAL